jgi:hypothetical protein
MEDSHSCILIAFLGGAIQFGEVRFCRYSVVEARASTFITAGGQQTESTLEPASKVSVVDSRLQQTAFESDTGRSAVAAGTALYAPNPTLNPLGLQNRIRATA